MIKPDVLQYLKDNFYLASTNGALVITNKFYRELGIICAESTDSRPEPIKLPTLKPAITTKEIYKQFIQDAKVPSKIETNSGAYWANRYSEAGFKAFKKVYDDAKINRQVLLAATKWYYAQTRTARKMIGTYFSEGIWESCYDDFVRAKDQQKPTPKIVDDENTSNMQQG